MPVFFISVFKLCMNCFMELELSKRKQKRVKRKVSLSTMFNDIGIFMVVAAS